MAESILFRDGSNNLYEASATNPFPQNQITATAGENLSANRMMMSRPGTSTRITTATTTTARSGTGVITRFLIEAALTGTATVYDNTAASGTILTILPIGFAAGSHQADFSFGTGCTVVTSAADRVVVVVEPN